MLAFVGRERCVAGLLSFVVDQRGPWPGAVVFRIVPAPAHVRLRCRAIQHWTGRRVPAFSGVPPYIEIVFASVLK